MQIYNYKIHTDMIADMQVSLHSCGLLRSNRWRYHKSRMCLLTELLISNGRYVWDNVYCMAGPDSRVRRATHELCVASNAVYCIKAFKAADGDMAPSDNIQCCTIAIRSDTDYLDYDMYIIIICYGKMLRQSKVIILCTLCEGSRKKCNILGNAYILCVLSTSKTKKKLHVFCIFCS